MQTLPGWYADGSGRLRWWDGLKWTESTAPMPPTPPAATVTVQQSESPVATTDEPVAEPQPAIATEAAQATASAALARPARTTWAEFKAEAHAQNEERARQKAEAKAPSVSPAARALERNAERSAKIQARNVARETALEKRADAKASRAAIRAKAAHTREIAQANKGFDKRHADWDSLNREVQSALQTARTFRPSGGEYFGTPAQLIEQRAGARTYVGASRGVSIPVGSIGGRSIRYRAGATKGHVVQGDPVDKVIDTGRVVVTAVGVNFVGANQTRVSDYKKMVDLSITNGELRISVSNRQKITRLRPASSQLTGLMLAIHLAQADASGSRDGLITQLEAEAARIASIEPQRAT